MTYIHDTLIHTHLDVGKLFNLIGCTYFGVQIYTTNTTTREKYIQINRKIGKPEKVDKMVQDCIGRDSLKTYSLFCIYFQGHNNQRLCIYRTNFACPYAVF